MPLVSKFELAVAGPVLFALAQLERLHLDNNSTYVLQCTVARTTATVHHLFFASVLLEVDTNWGTRRRFHPGEVIGESARTIRSPSSYLAASTALARPLASATVSPGATPAAPDTSTRARVVVPWLSLRLVVKERLVAVVKEQLI